MRIKEIKVGDKCIYEPADNVTSPSNVIPTLKERVLPSVQFIKSVPYKIGGGDWVCLLESGIVAPIRDLTKIKYQ